MQFWNAKGPKYAILRLITYACLGCPRSQICNFDNHQICILGKHRVSNMQFWKLTVTTYAFLGVPRIQICNFAFSEGCVYSICGAGFRGKIWTCISFLIIDIWSCHSNHVSLEDSKPKLVMLSLPQEPDFGSPGFCIFLQSVDVRRCVGVVVCGCGCGCGCGLGQKCGRIYFATVETKSKSKSANWELTGKQKQTHAQGNDF